MDRLIANDGILETLDLQAVFGNANPVDLDIGCGTGRFLIARAQTHPDRNLLGIERLLGRARTVLAKAERLALPNVRLLRIEAGYALAHRLPEQSIDTAFIAFPDPWPKRRHHRRRLIQAETVDSLHRVLRPGGRVYFSTDHEDYFTWVRALFRDDRRWEAISPYIPTPEETSSFEQLWSAQGRPIYRCGFQAASSVNARTVVRRGTRTSR